MGWILIRKGRRYKKKHTAAAFTWNYWEAIVSGYVIIDPEYKNSKCTQVKDLSLILSEKIISKYILKALFKAR